MTSQQIEYFLAVARHLSFTKAAQSLYVTQPAISRQISALEADLGFTLFDRARGKTALTAEGELFYELFSSYAKEFAATVQKAKELTDSQTGTVSMGHLSGWNLSGFLPQLIERFNAAYPNVSVSIESRGFRSLLTALRNDKVDVILTLDVTIDRDADIAIQPLTEIPRILLYPATKQRTDGERMTVADFKNDTFWVVSEEEVPRAAEFVRSYCAPYGFEPKVRTVPNIESMLTALQNGLGVAIMDVWQRDRTNEAFRYLTLPSSHAVSLAWRKSNPNPAIPLFINEITLLFHNQPGSFIRNNEGDGRP